MENIKYKNEGSIVNRSYESSFGIYETKKNRSVNFNSLETFIYSRTIAEDKFKENSKALFTVIYRTLDAIAAFELNHHGPVTIEMLNLFCNKWGIETLKNLVSDSIVKYRRDIAENLNKTLEYSETYLDAVCSSVQNRIEEYTEQEIR